MKKHSLILLVAGAALALAGCATGEAGRASTPQDFRSVFRIETFTASTGDGGTLTITFTTPGSLSSVPSSTATQTPTATATTQAEIPVNITPGSGTTVK